jgi:hypothetical protein
MDAEVSTHTFLTMIIEESVCLMSCEPFFFCNYSYVEHTEYIFTCIQHFVHQLNSAHERKSSPRKSSNLGPRAYHLHYCRTDRIICCQIFCDLLLKSAFGRIFNVMQLILVKIKWHIKWKYLIQKFNDICLSYYFKFT